MIPPPQNFTLDGKKVPKVAVLMGGPDEEHAISIESGNAVLGALKQAGLKAEGIELGRDGLWYYRDDSVKTPGRALDNLKRDFDVAFLALHGKTGEGGIVQGALELIGMPFTGSDSVASCLAMNKAVSRALYEEAGIPVAPGAVIHPDDPRKPDVIADELIASFGLPLFSKPLDSGSSYGVRIEKDAPSLTKRISSSRKIEQVLLLEQRIEGPEYTVAVIDGDAGSISLPPVLIRPTKGAEFFTLEIKYDPEAVEEICPAPASPEVLSELTRLGVLAHKVLGCRDFSRTDILWGEQGPVVLETNTIPGLTSASLFPKAARAAGIDFPELVRMLVYNAVTRTQGRVPGT
jgi:D-alanine-D-alanine ligase